MVKRKRIYISHERKVEIIKEPIQANSDIKLLAVKYEVRVKTLSKWRSDYYKAEQRKETIKPEKHFIEVQVGNDIKNDYLKKVELLLSNQRCSIECHCQLKRYPV